MIKYGILKDSQSSPLTNDDVILGFSAPIQIISNQPTFSSDTLSLKRFSFQQPVQRWEIETGIEPSNDSANALVHQIRFGHTSKFSIRMPQPYIGQDMFNSSQLSDYSLSLDVTSNPAAIGSSTVNVSGVTSSEIGRFFKFSNHNKVYLVTGVSGSTVTFKPNLLIAVNNAVKMLRGGNVIMKAIYDDSVQLGIKYVDGILSDLGSIKLIEAL